MFMRWVYLCMHVYMCGFILGDQSLMLGGFLNRSFVIIHGGSLSLSLEPNNLTRAAGQIALRILCLHFLSSGITHRLPHTPCRLSIRDANSSS